LGLKKARTVAIEGKSFVLPERRHRIRINAQPVRRERQIFSGSYVYHWIEHEDEW
jgi:hypothetical protein